MEVLTEERRHRLVELVTSALRSQPLDAPLRSELEAEYTKRCLAPLLERTVADIGFPGLVPLGSQGSTMVSCHFLGSNFYPDLGVRFYDTYAMAVEVKLLRDVNRQNSIATAIGQGAVYKSRFASSAVMLIDTRGRLTSDEVGASAAHLERLGVPLIVRTTTRSGVLLPQP